jgi:hypothetical protein
MAGWIALTPQLPMKLEMARQVWDESRHTEIFEGLLAATR